MEVLLSEVEKARKSLLFGGLSGGMSNKRKLIEWHRVVQALKSLEVLKVAQRPQ